MKSARSPICFSRAGQTGSQLPRHLARAWQHHQAYLDLPEHQQGVQTHLGHGELAIHARVQRQAYVVDVPAGSEGDVSWQGPGGPGGYPGAPTTRYPS